MGHVVEAFRFLSGRATALKARLAHEDRPVEGAAWLVPAPDLGPWATRSPRTCRRESPGGDVVHADCGEGALLRAFAAAAGGAGASFVAPWRCVPSSVAARSRSVRRRAPGPPTGRARRIVLRGWSTVCRCTAPAAARGVPAALGARRARRRRLRAVTGDRRATREPGPVDLIEGRSSTR